MGSNRLLDLERKFRSRNAKAAQLGGFVRAMGFPTTAVWPGKAILPTPGSSNYWTLSWQIKNEMISFGEAYVNKISRNSSISVNDRVDYNTLGNHYGWLACKDFFFALIVIAFKKLDLPFYYAAKAKKEMLYISSKDGGSVDYMLRGGKLYIGFMKKYLERVNRAEVKKGDIFFYYGVYANATGHVRLVTDVQKSGNSTNVTVLEGHRSPSHKSVTASTDSEKEQQLPEIRTYKLKDLMDEQPYKGGIVRIKWEELWSDKLMNKKIARYSLTKKNYAKRYYNIFSRSDSSLADRMLKNDEFYNPVMKKL